MEVRQVHVHVLVHVLVQDFEELKRTKYNINTRIRTSTVLVCAREAGTAGPAGTWHHQQSSKITRQDYGNTLELRRDTPEARTLRPYSYVYNCTAPQPPFIYG